MNPAAKIVEDYLRVLMIPDPAAARRYYDAEWLLVRAGLARP